MSQPQPYLEEDEGPSTPWGMIIGVILAILLVVIAACGGVAAVFVMRAQSEAEKIGWEVQREMDGADGEVVFDKQLRTDAAGQAAAALRNFKYQLDSSEEKPRVYADGKMYEIYGTAKKSGDTYDFIIKLELTRNSATTRNWTLEAVVIDGETTWTKPAQGGL